MNSKQIRVSIIGNVAHVISGQAVGDSYFMLKPELLEKVMTFNRHLTLPNEIWFLEIKWNDQGANQMSITPDYEHYRKTIMSAYAQLPTLESKYEAL